MQFEDGVGHCRENSFALQDVDVPNPESQSERSLSTKTKDWKCYFIKQCERSQVGGGDSQQCDFLDSQLAQKCIYDDKEIPTTFCLNVLHLNLSLLVLK